MWKCVIDKLLKMSNSLVGRNIPSQQCGKDISINVSWPSVQKCVYMAMWQDTFTGVTKKHCGLDTYIKCVIAQCAEICLHDYVAKTHFIEVQRKSSILCV